MPIELPQVDSETFKSWLISMSIWCLDLVGFLISVAAKILISPHQRSYSPASGNRHRA